MPLRESFVPLIDLLYPPRCPLCGAGIGGQTGLCAGCWSELAIPGEPACTSCGRPFGDTMPEGGTCAPCFAQPPRHDGIAAATLYNDASRRLVLSLKHGNRIALAPMMAGLIAAKLVTMDAWAGVRDPGDMAPPSGERAEWIVVPVPLHRWRLWSRGYNQAAELGRFLARRTGARLEVDALVRRKATRSLGGLGKLARARMLSGAIAVKRPALVKGANVVLVDDVLTSGATSGACVSALKRAGAGRVVIACFARVLDDALDSV